MRFTIIKSNIEIHRLSKKRNKPNKLRGMACDGLALLSGGVEILPAATEPGVSSSSCEPVGSEASF